MNVVFFGFKRDGLAYLNDEQADALRSVEVQKNDVLLNITGASIGRVTVVPDDLAGARVNQHVCIIRPTAALDAQFLAAFLSTSEFQFRLTQEHYGVTRQALTKAQILDFEIPLPPLAQQRAMVTELRTHHVRVDAACAALDEVPALLDKLKQSVLAAAFRGDLTADWRARNPDVEPASVLLDRIRHTRSYSERIARTGRTAASAHSIPQYSPLPAGWQWATLGEICDVQLGQRRAPEYVDCVEYPYIRAANITWRGLDLSDVKTMGFDKVEELLLRRGDILVTEASGSASEVGKAAVWNDEIGTCSFQATVLRLRPGAETNSGWLHLFCLAQAILGRYLGNTPGIGILHLTSTRMKAWPVPLAPAAEQIEIHRSAHAALEAIYGLEDEVTAMQDRVSTLNGAILSRAFAGGSRP